MTRQQIVFHRSPMERRRFLLDSDERSSRGSHRLAEVAGGTTAECAAVVCCFPCTVVNILVLAVYKVPAGLCRKALKKQRHRRLLKKGLLVQSAGDGDSGDGKRTNRTGHRFNVDRTEFALRPVERFDRFNIDRTEFALRPVERFDRFNIDQTEFLVRPVDEFDRTEFLVRPVVVKPMAGDEEFMELENEMWETFYGTGFWRSLSQRVH